MSVDSTPQILLLVAQLFEKRVEDASKIRVDDTMTYIKGFFMPHQSAKTFQTSNSNSHVCSVSC
jgi:hypothetical protein